MKRIIALVFVVFWSIGLFFLINFFSNLRSIYRPKANLSQNTVLKILPILANSGQNLSPEKINEIASRYNGLIIDTSDLEALKSLSRSLRAINPEFKLYLQVSFSQQLADKLPFGTQTQNQTWLLTDKIIDIRDPLYRQAFFNYWKAQFNETKISGFYLTGIHPCPATVSDSVCQAQYPWWEMSVLDFMAQIRQYFGEQTILIEGSPIVDSQEEFTKKVLLQSDGILLRDFASIYSDQNTFARYYQFLSSLLQDPQNREKQLIFTVTADPSLQRFFQASYLLFANEFSSYYFSDGQAETVYWQTEWEQEYQPSLNPAIMIENGLYQRELGNALVLVNPGLLNQNLVLDQPLLEIDTGRVWQDRPIKFQDNLLLEPKSGYVINLLSDTIVSITPLSEKMAEWSDRNSSVYSDFEDQYLLRDPSSILLGNLASSETSSKNYDNSDDGIKIDGLEAGIFNLKRNQTYVVEAVITNLVASARIEIFIDWDGRGNLAPELVYQLSPLTQSKVNFNLTVPANAGEYLFLRAIVKDENRGEIEDYVLKVEPF